MLHPKNGKTEYKKKIESYPGLRHALFKVEAYIEPYREDRNMIAHHKNIDYSELRAVEMYSVLVSLYIGDDTDFLSNFKVVAKVETDRVVANLKKLLEVFNSELEVLLKEVYDILKSIFNEKYKEILNTGKDTLKSEQTSSYIANSKA